MEMRELCVTNKELAHNQNSCGHKCKMRNDATLVTRILKCLWVTVSAALKYKWDSCFFNASNDSSFEQLLALNKINNTDVGMK